MCETLGRQRQRQHCHLHFRVSTVPVQYCTVYNLWWHTGAAQRNAAQAHEQLCYQIISYTFQILSKYFTNTVELSVWVMSTSEQCSLCRWIVNNPEQYGQWTLNTGALWTRHEAESLTLNSVHRQRDWTPEQQMRVQLEQKHLARTNCRSTRAPGVATVAGGSRSRLLKPGHNLWKPWLATFFTSGERELQSFSALLLNWERWRCFVTGSILAYSQLFLRIVARNSTPNSFEYFPDLTLIVTFD